MLNFATQDTVEYTVERINTKACFYFYAFVIFVIGY